MNYEHNKKAEVAFELLTEVLQNDMDEDLENFIGEVKLLLDKALKIKQISNEINSGSLE
jgi:uncharacterized iron-regulated protein